MHEGCLYVSSVDNYFLCLALMTNLTLCLFSNILIPLQSIVKNQWYSMKVVISYQLLKCAFKIWHIVQSHDFVLENIILNKVIVFYFVLKPIKVLQRLLSLKLLNH